MGNRVADKDWSENGRCTRCLSDIFEDFPQPSSPARTDGPKSDRQIVLPNNPSTRSTKVNSQLLGVVSHNNRNRETCNRVSMVKKNNKENNKENDLP